MPGITGIINKGSNIDTQNYISSITEGMKYEDFYKTEIHTHNNTAFGLSTFVAGNKIIVNHKTNIIGLMEGEVFGDKDFALETLCENKKFSAPEIWKKVTGRFAFAFYDINAKKLFLVTDHYGIKPLFYTITDNKFIFASSINAICKVIKAEVNLQALAEYAVFNFPLENNTFAKGISRVPAGELLEIDSEFNISRKKYFELTDITSQPILNARQSLKLSSEAFNKSINDLIKDDKVLGLTLTGGYDTRTILSSLPSNREIQSLTVGSENDTQVRIASQLSGLSKNLLWIMQDYEDDFVENIEKFILRTVKYTDGLCEITHSGWLYIFEKYRDYLDPCFTGLGGSELLRGLQNVDFPINYNIKQLLTGEGLSPFNSIIGNENSYGFFSYKLLKDNPPSPVILSPSPVILSEAKNLNSFRAGSAKNLTPPERATRFTLYEIFRKYYGAIIALEESQVRIRAPYMDNSFISFILQTPFSILHTKQFSGNLFERLKGQKLSATIINQNAPDLSFLSTDRGYAPVANLTPLGLPIILFQQMRNRFSPRRHYNRSSCDEYLRDYAKEILEEPKTLKRQYYNRDKIMKALTSYPNWSLKEWEELAKVVTFELWLREISVLSYYS